MPHMCSLSKVASENHFQKKTFRCVTGVIYVSLSQQSSAAVQCLCTVTYIISITLSTTNVHYAH